MFSMNLLFLLLQENYLMQITSLTKVLENTCMHLYCPIITERFFQTGTKSLAQSLLGSSNSEDSKGGTLAQHQILLAGVSNTYCIQKKSAKGRICSKSLIDKKKRKLGMVVYSGGRKRQMSMNSSLSWPPQQIPD